MYMNPTPGQWIFLFHRLMNCSRPVSLLFLIFILSHSSIRAQEKCKVCSVPSFAALTIYHTLQTGSAMGFGIEAGKWKKDDGKFSYFLGTSMIWAENDQQDQKTSENSKELAISFYWKGQYKIANRLYLIAQPELINLSSFEMRAGARYVFPLTKILGIGLEPGYSLIKKEWSFNTNIHFAL